MAGRISLYFSDCFKYSWMSSTVTIAWTFDAELLVDLHDGGFAGNLTYLAAVDGDEHIVDFHIAAAVEDRRSRAQR